MLEETKISELITQSNYKKMEKRMNQMDEHTYDSPGRIQKLTT